MNSAQVRMVAIGGLALACVAAGGCSAAHKTRLAKPPGIVVPGVDSGGSVTPGGSGGSGGGTGPGGKAGSHGTVLLGGWAPGGKRNAVAAGALAYFSWLNAHGGVFGRRIEYRVLDDHASSRVVPSLVHQLVQGDAVFAIFGAQGAQGNAVTSFLDTSGVPDVFAGWTCGCLGSSGQQLPEIFGWPLGETREGAVLGAYVAQHDKGQKVAVVFAPGQQRGAEMAGFTAAARGVKVVSKVAAGSASAVASAISAANSAGARVVVSFAAAGVTARLSSAMSAARWRVPLVAAGGGLGAGLPDRVITDGFLPSAGAPASSAAGSWISLFRKIRAKYLASAPFSPAMVDGMASAYEMASVMFRSGQVLTRQALVSALDGMQPGPAAAPLTYALSDHSGPDGGYVGTMQGGVLVPSSGVLITASAQVGARITGDTSPEQQAPGDGIPPH